MMHQRGRTFDRFVVSGPTPPILFISLEKHVSLSSPVLLSEDNNISGQDR